ncbi:MAG: HNH/ENDO VII family nuclease [Oligosphaeraceae bacterium]
MSALPLVTSPSVEHHTSINQQVEDQSNSLQNELSVKVEQNLPSELTNKVECEKNLSEYLKEVFPDISPEELVIYEKAGLDVEKLGGRVSLTQPEIDLDYKDANDMTNLERMENGLAPINPRDGLPYELHHVGQKNNVPLAEFTHSEHMSPENNKVLHPVRSGSEVEHGYSWRDIREEHWRVRAEQFRHNIQGECQ